MQCLDGVRRVRLDVAATVLTWNHAHDILADVDVGFDRQGTGVHGTHALELLLAARIELLVEGRVSIDEQLNVGLDPAGNVGDALDLEAQTAVAGREGDVEQGGGEGRVGHARVERLGFDDALGGDERRSCSGEP